MPKRIYTVLTITTLIFTSVAFDFLPKAQAASESSDRLSLSWPGAGADHAIKFKLANDVPAGGRLVITPEPGAFFIMSSFDVAEVDLATSSSANGPFNDRELASTTSTAEDGVSVVASTTHGRVEIELNSTAGLAADTYIQIELGLNAGHNGFGTAQIVNPATTTSYSFNTEIFDAADNFIERAYARVFIIEPVTMSNFVTFKRSGGSPLGWLGFGTTQTIMSLLSNYPAHCRYSTASGTPYANMTEMFTYAGPGGDSYHTTFISGLQNGQQYDIFIRCQPTFGSYSADDPTECHYASASTTPWTDPMGNPVTDLDCTDYWLHFGVTGIEGAQGDSSGEGDPDNPGEGDGGSSGSAPGTGGGGGGSGGGSGGGRGNERGRDRGEYLPYPPPPGAPGVGFVGWTYPNRDVNVLQDGSQVGYVTADQNGEFGAFLEDLNQGVYTFSVWSDDINGLQSPAYSTTFWIDAGTQTTVTDIIIAPTIALNSSSAEAGGMVEVSGYATAGQSVETWLYPSDLQEPALAQAQTAAAVPDASGRYTAYVSTADLSAGSYKVQSRTAIAEVGTSNWSKSVNLALGGEAEATGACAGADLNQDGRVNLTDFSILLYHWGTDNDCADQNDNGKVDLTDFSIMLYHWTG